MFIKILLTVLSCLVISTNSFAENTNINSNQALNKSPFFFINFSSEDKEIYLIPYDKIVIDKRNNDIRYFWSVFVNQNGTIPFDMLQMYQKINCTERKVHRLQSNIYSKLQSKFQLVKTINIENDKDSIRYVTPDTVGEFAANLVCHAGNLTSEEQSRILFFQKDPEAFFYEVQNTILFLLGQEREQK